MDVLALLLADSRFPSGGYAHSLGLEQAVAGGLRVDAVAAFAESRLRLVAAADARAAVAARRAGGDLPALLAIDGEWAARCPSPILRDSARRLGAQLLRAAATAFGGAPIAAAGAAPPEGPDPQAIAAYRSASALTPRPVALGVVAAAVGLDDEATAVLALYDDAATVTGAAPKLLPVDAAAMSGVLARLAPALERLAGEVAADRRPLHEQPGPAAVAVELAAEAHQHRRERLFAS
jgi:urease accessory protein